jgi:hypothetical protein
MHAPWLSNDDFDTIAEGNLKANDKIRYRCTNYPDKYEQAKVEYIKNNYKAKIPGLEIGMDIAFSDKIVANAAEIKSQGFDFVEYNLETAFDGPNSDADAKDNVEKVRRAAEAVHAQGMKFKVAPGKPNSTSFFRTGLLDDVAKLVDQYHIQAQSIQDTTSAEYASFTEQITKALRAANPSIVVTSQISPSQGAQPGGTLQETMRSCIAAAMAKQPPGNTNGFGMWIGGDYVAEAKAFYSWFKQTNL